MIDNLVDLENTIQDGDLVVEFYATWCGACKNAAPVYEKISNEHDNIEFYKIDIDTNRSAIKKLGIKSLPTFVFYHDGEKIDEVIGMNKNQLEEIIKSYA
jgi:thioredoxin 1